MNTKTISPEWLRAQVSAPGGVIPLSACLGGMLADAIEIADINARVDIESFCSREGGAPWWDLASAEGDEYEEEVIKRAAHYLDARGLIEHKIDAKHWVRFLDAPKVD